jgi:diguanylate cyclase (GGDEF)-like protein/PAS domain S-box-containing protein
VTRNRSRAGDEAGLLAFLRRPDAVFSAADAHGVQVPVPASLGLDAGRTLSVPSEPRTLLDLILADDALTVITGWEVTLARGNSVITVRTRQEPDRLVRLSSIDIRASHGVVLIAMEAASTESELDRPAADDGWTTVSRTPRTAEVRKNTTGVITGIDERTTRMLGWRAEQMVGQRSTVFVHPDDQERAIAVWLEMLTSGTSQRLRLRHGRADGTWAWLELENHYVPADDAVVTQMTDISDEMAAHEALRAQERLLRRVAESLPLSIVQLAADRSAVFTNSRFDDLTGLPHGDVVAGLEAVLASADRPAFDAALTAALDDGRDGELEVTVERPGAARRTHSLRLVALGDQEGAPGALLAFADITAQAELRDTLAVRATTDPLTGVANREAVSAVLDEALAESGDGMVAVVFVDLDGFKPINDTYGHDAGDELLRVAAARLRAAVRPGDVVGRIGGDEFLVVSRGHTEAGTAMALGRRLRSMFAEPAALPHGPIPLRASIGVACGRAGSEAADLIREADQAMYRSKQQGRGRPVLAGT